jgi:hypothetical protein
MLKGTDYRHITGRPYRAPVVKFGPQHTRPSTHTHSRLPNQAIHTRTHAQVHTGTHRVVVVGGERQRRRGGESLAMAANPRRRVQPEHRVRHLLGQEEAKHNTRKKKVGCLWDGLTDDSVWQRLGNHNGCSQNAAAGTVVRRSRGPLGGAHDAGTQPRSTPRWHADTRIHTTRAYTQHARTASSHLCGHADAGAAAHHGSREPLQQRALGRDGLQTVALHGLHIKSRDKEQIKSRDKEQLKSRGAVVEAPPYMCVLSCIR